MMISHPSKFLLIFALLIGGLTACNTSKINKDYLILQNDRDNIIKGQLKDVLIKPNDLLNIQIYSLTLEPQQAALFNVTAGQGYLVGVNGKIEIPIIGEITASGLTRYQLQDVIKNKVSYHIKEPSVVVRFQNFTINVLGEVNSPGTKPFLTDKVTIIDAISAAGDLTANGLRENVMVSREDSEGFRKFYEIDLRSASLFNSPVYQLQQNDIIYVNANTAKLKAVNERGPDAMSMLQLGLTLIGAVTTIYFLFAREK